MSDIPQALRQAYAEAQYWFREQGRDHLLTIGQPCPRLDNLLLEHGFKQAWFITASNPGSELLSADENAVRNHALAEQLNLYVVFPALGQDPQQRWPAEEGFVVLGASRQGMCQLAKDYEQNAVVRYPVGGHAQLVWT